MAATEGKAPKPATKAISATISEADFNAIEDYRWSVVRMNLSQVISQAVAEFVTNHQLGKAADSK